jgi:hypothetical protein
MCSFDMTVHATRPPGRLCCVADVHLTFTLRCLAMVPTDTPMPRACCGST